MRGDQLAFRFGDNAERIRGVSRDWWDERNKFVKDRIDSIPEDVILIDATNRFCDEDFCYANDQDGYITMMIIIYGSMAEQIVEMIAIKGSIN